MANAGSNVILNLPKNSVTLNGNASTDDHGITAYEWSKTSEDTPTPDMQVGELYRHCVMYSLFFLKFIIDDHLFLFTQTYVKAQRSTLIY